MKAPIMNIRRSSYCH